MQIGFAYPDKGTFIGILRAGLWQKGAKIEHSEHFWCKGKLA